MLYCDQALFWQIYKAAKRSQKTYLIFNTSFYPFPWSYLTWVRTSCSPQLIYLQFRRTCYELRHSMYQLFIKAEDVFIATYNMMTNTRMKRKIWNLWIDIDRDISCKQTLIILLIIINLLCKSRTSIIFLLLVRITVKARSCFI